MVNVWSNSLSPLHSAPHRPSRLVQAPSPQPHRTTEAQLEALVWNEHAKRLKAYKSGGEIGECSNTVKRGSGDAGWGWWGWLVGTGSCLGCGCVVHASTGPQLPLRVASPRPQPAARRHR